MAELHQRDEEGRPLGAVPPGVGKAGGKRWFRRGVIVGLLLWVAVSPLLGDPRISDVVTPIDGAGPPVFLARTLFRVVAEAPVETLAQAPKPGILPSTKAQLEAVRPVLWAMAMPEVRESLGYSAEPVSVVTIPTPETPQPAPAEPMFSYPENMSPGSPSASLAQVMNPTKNIIMAEFRPTVAGGQDSRLCPGLRVAVVSVVAGKAPKVVAQGKLMDMIDDRAAPMVMEPGVRYNLAILVSVPLDAGNEYQGVSCSVDFMMQAQGI